MSVPEELLSAAHALGEALYHSPAVQALRQAEQAVEDDPEVKRLRGEVDRIYADLLARQQAGELVYPYEVNQFYEMRDRLVRHPLMVDRAEKLQAVKGLCEQVGGTISSILTIDYSSLVLE